MEKMGLEAIYRKPKLSEPHPSHKVYPYLLRGVKITRVNQVWSTDITYIRLRRGFVYLTAVVDWYNRCVLSWRLSTGLDTSFCVDALEEAIERYGTTDVFNTDQGGSVHQYGLYVRLEQTRRKNQHGRKGRALDNVFVERLWRTVKYEEVYLKEYGSVAECRAEMAAFFDRYNTRRPHQSLGYRYPKDVFMEGITHSIAA